VVEDNPAGRLRFICAEPAAVDKFKAYARENLSIARFRAGGLGAAG
jgi:hypothetical protein